MERAQALQKLRARWAQCKQAEPDTTLQSRVLIERFPELVRLASALSRFESHVVRHGPGRGAELSSLFADMLSDRITPQDVMAPLSRLLHSEIPPHYVKTLEDMLQEKRRAEALERRATLQMVGGVGVRRVVWCGVVWVWVWCGCGVVWCCDVSRSHLHPHSSASIQADKQTDGRTDRHRHR